MSRQRTLTTAGSLVIAVIAALAMALTAVTPANATGGVTTTDNNGAVVKTDGKARNYFGAVSLNLIDGKIGIANDKRSKGAALKAAVKSCKKKSSNKNGCKRTAWVRNGCGALALKAKANGSYKQAWGVAFNLAPAKKKAKKKAGKGSKVYAWVCTTRFN